jgi:hypothetical protein
VNEGLELVLGIGWMTGLAGAALGLAAAIVVQGESLGAVGSIQVRKTSLHIARWVEAWLRNLKLQSIRKISLMKVIEIYESFHLRGVSSSNVRILWMFKVELLVFAWFCRSDVGLKGESVILAAGSTTHCVARRIVESSCRWLEVLFGLWDSLRRVCYHLGSVEMFNGMLEALLKWTEVMMLLLDLQHQCLVIAKMSVQAISEPGWAAHLLLYI